MKNAEHLNYELKLYVQNGRKEFSERIEGDKRVVADSGLTELITLWRYLIDKKITSINVSYFDENTILIHKE